ncbi:hypothetical protein L1887_37033 [Cichorium endivia]|nr:hypothetical protein L1887_37033 [Cichorium endivia]
MNHPFKMRNFFITFFIFFLPFISIDHSVAKEWLPINIKDPKAMELAKYAVQSDNKLTGGDLTFVRVISGTYIDNADLKLGKTYDMMIFVMDGREEVRYNAVVRDDPPPDGKHVVIFNPK